MGQYTNIARWRALWKFEKDIQPLTSKWSDQPLIFQWVKTGILWRKSQEKCPPLSQESSHNLLNSFCSSRLLFIFRISIITRLYWETRITDVSVGDGFLDFLVSGRLSLAVEPIGNRAISLRPVLLRTSVNHLQILFRCWVVLFYIIRGKTKKQCIKVSRWREILIMLKEAQYQTNWIFSVLSSNPEQHVVDVHPAFLVWAQCCHVQWTPQLLTNQNIKSFIMLSPQITINTNIGGSNWKIRLSNIRTNRKILTILTPI